jgi:uncharacterized delta-60 repeat protein
VVHRARSVFTSRIGAVAAVAASLPARAWLGASLPACAWLGIALAPGCQAIIGIHDVELDPGTGGVTAGSTTTGSTTTGSTTTASGSGTGGQSSPGFTLVVKDPSVNVPYGALGDVHLEIDPSGGFAGDVSVAVVGAPTGLTVQPAPLLIPAGTTSGVIRVEAGGALTIGTKFPLMLTATSGAISANAATTALVTGAPGSFDTSFGGTGLVLGPTSSLEVDVNEILEDQVGRIVLAAFSIGSHGGGIAKGLRFLVDGTPDTSFGGTGSVDLAVLPGTTGGGLESVVREVNNTLVFAGWAKSTVAGMGSDIFIYPFVDGPDGGAEVIYNGIQLVPGPEALTLNAAALAFGSSYLVAVGELNNQIFVSRIPDQKPMGLPDPSFASNGSFLASTGTASGAEALAIDGATGAIVVAGYVSNATDAGADEDVVVLRLTRGGALDASFGSAGMVSVPRPGNQRGASVLIEPSGAIVVGATTDEGGGQGLVLRFLPSGQPDTSFGAQGAQLVPNGAGPLLVRMIDGRFIAGGTSGNPGSSGPVLARLSPTGAIDASYGNNGSLVVPVGSISATLGAMLLASDGKLLIAGATTSPTSGGSYLARLWN